MVRIKVLKAYSLDNSYFVKTYYKNKLFSMKKSDIFGNSSFNICHMGLYLFVFYTDCECFKKWININSNNQIIIFYFFHNNIRVIKLTDKNYQDLPIEKGRLKLG